MTEYAKREVREWVLTLGVGMLGGMVSSALTLGWAVYVYHGG